MDLPPPSQPASRKPSASTEKATKPADNATARASDVSSQGERAAIASVHATTTASARRARTSMINVGELVDDMNPFRVGRTLPPHEVGE
jgi:hypothetical protein